MKGRASIVVAVIVLVEAWTPSQARAQSAELKYDLRVDVPVTLAATTWLIGSELAKSQLAATVCRWCDRAPDGMDDLNAVDITFRDALRWRSPGAADTLSSVVGYGLVPIASFGVLALAQAHDEALGRLPLDALLIAEAVAVSASVSQIVKLSVGRERPFVHALAAADKATTAQPSDNNTSFYSGHTNLAFSLAVSAGTVASIRGYRWAPWVWVTGLSLATATGYLRIAGDRHYFTDVFAGATMGVAIGFAVPFVFHRPASQVMPVVSVSNLSGGFMANFTWVQ